MHYGQALIGTCDLRGVVLSVNPAFATLMRKNAVDILGQPLTNRMLSEDRELFEVYLVCITANGKDRGGRAAPCKCTTSFTTT